MPSTIVCTDCGVEIDPVTDPSFCPICGSGNRLIEARDEATITIYEQIGLKKKRPGKKKPYEEIKIGDDFHRKTGQWNRLERVIDHDNDRYFEHIEDAAGNTIRHCDEPLSQHQGHGSAKKPEMPATPGDQRGLPVHGLRRANLTWYGIRKVTVASLRCLPSYHPRTLR